MTFLPALYAAWFRVQRADGSGLPAMPYTPRT
jgi:hypothetical protein